jgi:hypothetical protein
VVKEIKELKVDKELKDQQVIKVHKELKEHKVDKVLKDQQGLKD